MKSLLNVFLFASSLSVASFAYCEPVDLTPERLRVGTEVVVTGSVDNIEDYLSYPEESFQDGDELKPYFTYRLKTGVLSDNLIFYSKIEHDKSYEVTVNGKLQMHLPGEGVKGHGILMLMEE